MNHLVPCPECSRHVRVSEKECPFCALPLDLAGTPEPQLPRGRLSRAATLAFGATLVSATALAACGGDVEESTGSGGVSNSAGTSAAGAATGGFGDGTAVPVYGSPAGGEIGSGGSPFLDGGGAALYGAPASDDAGMGGTFNYPGASGASGEAGAAGASGDAAASGGKGGGSAPIYGGPP